MTNLDKEFHKAHSELANTIGGLNTALRTTSQATGDVAASDWQIIQEINQDKAIIQELNISAMTEYRPTFIVYARNWLKRQIMRIRYRF